MLTLDNRLIDAAEACNDARDRIGELEDMVKALKAANEELQEQIDDMKERAQ